MNFTDLTFESRSDHLSGTTARAHFPNGYGVSVITGEMFYTSPSQPYEVAVLCGDAICYSTPITDDVLGYQTEADVSEIMAQVAALPNAETPQ